MGWKDGRTNLRCFNGTVTNTSRERIVKVEITQGDLLDQNVDVIVNTWNRNIIPWWLLLPQGVSGAIKRRAGLKPFREVAKFGSIPLGNAVITSAGKLSHKAIIHVAGINLLWRASEYSIRNSVRNAIELAENHNFDSIAFPLIGAGSGSFNEKKSLEIMLNEIDKIKITLKIKVVKFNK